MKADDIADYTTSGAPSGCWNQCVIAKFDGLPPPMGFAATGNGEPLMLVSAPLLASMLNTVISEFSQSASSRNFPEGSTLISHTGAPPLRNGPLSNGEPGTGESVPLLWLTDMAVTTASGMKTNLPDGSTAAVLPAVAVGKGEPATGVSAPSAATV